MRQAVRLLFSTLCILVFAGVAFANSIASASIQPAPSTVFVGGNLTLNVTVAGVADLSAFQFDISFNPGVLSAQSIVEGAFLSSGGSTSFFIPGTIDNVGGTIAFNADSLIGPGPGVNGSGTIATIDFLAIAAGASSVNLANTIFLDSTGGNLNVSLAGGTVNVTPAAAIPEPPTSILMIVGIVLLFRLARKQFGPKSLVGRV
jgi:hypothetical protein